MENYSNSVCTYSTHGCVCDSVHVYIHAFCCVDTVDSVHMCEYSNLVEGWGTTERLCDSRNNNNDELEIPATAMQRMV